MSGLCLTRALSPVHRGAYVVPVVVAAVRRAAFQVERDPRLADDARVRAYKRNRQDTHGRVSVTAKRGQGNVAGLPYRRAPALRA